MPFRTHVTRDASRGFASDRSHLVIRQPTESILGLSVLGVVSIRADEEVTWIDAGRVVAGMADEHPGGDHPTRKSQRNMRGWTMAPVAPQLPISAWDTDANPRPTGIRTSGAIDFRPKPFFESRKNPGSSRHNGLRLTRELAPSATGDGLSRKRPSSRDLWRELASRVP